MIDSFGRVSPATSLSAAAARRRGAPVMAESICECCWKQDSRAIEMTGERRFRFGAMIRQDIERISPPARCLTARYTPLTRRNFMPMSPNASRGVDDTITNTTIGDGLFPDLATRSHASPRVLRQGLARGDCRSLGRRGRRAVSEVSVPAPMSPNGHAGV